MNGIGNCTMSYVKSVLQPGKRRYCTVKQLISGEVAVDIRKSRDTPPKRPQLIVGSAQLRSRRRGRTAIEVSESVSF